jgi:hypothetical protein
MPPEPVRVAVLDDYQGVAAGFADWSVLEPEAEVTFFRDALAHEDALTQRLTDFGIVVAMRERTAFRGASWSACRICGCW